MSLSLQVLSIGQIELLITQEEKLGYHQKFLVAGQTLTLPSLEIKYDDVISTQTTTH